MTAFTSLSEISQYLNQCRPRRLRTGDWSFEAHGIPDKTCDIRTFFAQNPQCKVSVNGAQRFVTLSDKAIDRLNAQLPEEVQIKPSNPVMMANKYS